MSSKYKLVSFKLCPYVQRSLIALEEKGVPYDIEYIDLKNKPDWFLALSPLGKVPILLVGEEVLFESAVICEFIDETAGGARLMPADPMQRAKNRAWIAVVSELLSRMYQLHRAAGEEEGMAAARNLRGGLALLEDALAGPLFNGEGFSLVDASAAPALQRVAWTDARVPGLGLLADLPRVKAWGELLASRPSVQRSTVPEIAGLFVDYLREMRGKGGAPTWVSGQLGG